MQTSFQLIWRSTLWLCRPLTLPQRSLNKTRGKRKRLMRYQFTITSRPLRILWLGANSPTWTLLTASITHSQVLYGEFDFSFPTLNLYWWHSDSACCVQVHLLLHEQICFHQQALHAVFTHHSRTYNRLSDTLLRSKAKVSCWSWPRVLVEHIVDINLLRRLLKTYKKIHKFANVISFFCTNEWTFTNDNVQKLWRNMSVDDQKLFYFDMKSLDWEVYIKEYMKGMRVYLFKDDLSNAAEARKKWRRLYK